jgi:MFS family permease
VDYSRNVKILTGQGFLIGLSLWWPIAAIYLAQVSGSYALGLSVFSIEMVSSAVLEIPTGIFSDLIGRKQTTILAGIFDLLGMIAYAIGINYGVLMIGAVGRGLARALYSGNNEALLYDSLNKSQRRAELEKWIGYVNGAEQGALGMAAIVGGLLAAKSMSLVVWLSVIPLILNLIASFGLDEVESETKGEGNVFSHLKEAWKNFIVNKKIRWLSLSEIVGFGLGEAGFQFSPVFVASLWPLWAIGVARMLANIGAAIGFGISGVLIKKFTSVKILMFEQVSSKFLSLAAFIFPTALSPVLLSSTSLMYGPSTVAQRSLLQKEFSDKQRATMGSINSLGKSLFYAMALLGLGLVADIKGPRIALILGQIIGIISIWMTWKAVRILRED